MAYPALYTRQDQGQQSMKQRCSLNERKDKSVASTGLIYICVLILNIAHVYTSYQAMTINPEVWVYSKGVHTIY